MDIQQIPKAIAGLSAAYATLNDEWQYDPCDIDQLQMLRQEKYAQFYNDYKDFNLEELIIGVISFKTEPAVLNHVRAQLKNNNTLYQNNKNKFEGFNTYKLFEFSEQQLFDNKLEVLNKDKADIEAYEYNTPGEQQKLLKEVEAAIKQLKSDISGYIHSGAWIRKNYYKDIHALTTKFLGILDSYFPKQDNTKTIPPPKHPSRQLPKATPVKEKIFINMRLASDIYGLCNGKQFEPLSETDFYQSLNNLPSKEIPIIKPGEKSRVYFLLHKITETLPTPDKKQWRDYIFGLLKINESQYKSKYREPISQMPSKKSRQFAKDLEEIFSNH